MDDWAAGVLPISVRPDGKCVVLLGRDSAAKGGKWSDFAGGREGRDATAADTAARELDEETGGVLRASRESLARCMLLRDATPGGRSMWRYALRIGYDAALPARFRGSKDDEKTALAWFPVRRLPPMRRVFAQQMRRDADALEAYAFKTRA